MSATERGLLTRSPGRADIIAELDLRISPKPVLGAMLLLGPMLYVLAAVLAIPREMTNRFITLSVAVQSLSATSWLLGRWCDPVGRWGTVVALVVASLLVSLFVEVPGALALMVIPAALTAPLVSVPAAALTATGETLLLLGLLAWRPQVLEVATLPVALLAVWVVVGAMHALHHPVRRLAQSTWEYYDHARRLLGEARGQKAALEQAMQDLAHSNRQLMLANERMAELRALAEEAQRAKTAFVANVSHEFRTPLNMIIGLVELMVEAPEIYAVSLSSAMQDDLRVVHRNCQHLAGLINDVLDLTRMEAGQLALHRERVDLREVVEDSVATIGPLLTKKHLALDVALPDDLPRIYCDRTRIQQVILNLVSNAARFTEAGGITLRATRENHHVILSVADTGPGIAPEDARRIFEPFCQGASELWRDKGGSGLGLSISEQFVKLHGGRMWLESELGVGSTFIVELPISAPMEHAFRPGHQIREDWIWRERASRSDSASLQPRPRVVVCDEIGDLHAVLSRCSSDVEFVDAEDLRAVTGELQQCPAQAVVINASTPGDAWALVEQAVQEAMTTPILGCRGPRRGRWTLVRWDTW